jgi:hypothetical protein
MNLATAAKRVLERPDALEATTLAQIHVGLQLNRFASEDVARLGGFVLENLAIVPRRSPLAARLRLGHAARSVVSGSLSGPVSEASVTRARACLESLLGDREPAVASVAAGALGALADYTSRESSDATGERRALSARSVAWLLGRSGAELAEIWQKADEFAIAEAIRALTPWRSLAPQTLDLALREACRSATATVLAALTEYAIAIPDDAAFNTWTEALRAAVRGVKGKPTGLELWRGPAATPAWAVLERWRAVRAAPTEETLAAVLKAITRGVKTAEEADTGAAVDAIDAALDITITTSTLLPDLLLATSESEREGSARWKAWSSIVGRTLERRASRLATGGEHKLVFRETTRRVARIIDAAPRAVLRSSKGESIGSDVLITTYAELARNKELMLDRPLTRLFATALDVTAEITPAETLALLLPLSPKLLRTYATSFAGIESALFQSLCALSDCVRETATALSRQRLQRKERRRLAGLVEEQLRAAGQALAILGDVPLAHALDQLLRGSSILLHGDAEALDAILANGIQGIAQSVREVLARHRMSVPASAGQGGGKTGQRLRTYLADPTNDEAERRRDLNRLLPRVFEDLLDVVITLQGSLDPEARGPSPGAIVGDYMVVKALGSGGMGSCLLARPRSSRSAPEVVLKLPRRTSPLYRSFFRNEAIALLKLADVPHPAIVKFVAFADGAGAPPHLVMDFVAGQSLEERIAKGPLKPDAVMRLTSTLAIALAHAHDRGVGHHDVKPANVMLARAREDSPVLVDWGIAGAAFQAHVGTPEYMSPERAATPVAGVSPLAGDVYALGCIVVEAASGTTFLGEPITAEDETAVPGIAAHFARLATTPSRRMLAAHMVATTPALRQGRIERALVGAPAWARDLTARMLDPDPRTRPTANDVATFLIGKMSQ